MKTADKTELVLAACVVATSAFFRQHLPQRMELGYFVLALGLLFLVQTLLRDLWLLFRLRKMDRESMPAAPCMCLESAIGFIPVITALILLSAGASHPIHLPPWAWPLGAAIVLLTGFGLKDYVFEWGPWRIRKDPDHINLRFSRMRR